MRKLFSILPATLFFCFAFAAPKPKTLNQFNSISFSSPVTIHALTDTLPPDSCFFRTIITKKCDSTFCVRLLGNCSDTCLCVYIVFQDGTIASQTVHIDAGSFIQLCFEKPIREVRCFAAECPVCFERKAITKTNFLSAAPQPLIYPNPAKDRLVISNVSQFKNLTIHINDLNGRRILQQNVNGSVVNISNLQRGTFIIELFQGTEKISSQKIIK